MHKIAVVMVVVLLVAGLPGSAVAQTGEVVTVARTAGADANVEVALALSELTDLGTVDTVVIARDDAFADALASGVLQRSAPLLLVPPAGPVPAAVDERLGELSPSRIIILGGEGAVSPAIESELSLDYAVERRAGASRLETAVAVARTDAPDATTAILARAFAPEGADATQAFADSLAAGGWAAANGWPVLLTQTEVLSQATATYLSESAVSRVMIVGGTVAVSAAVQTSLEDMGIEVQRVAGPSRFDTALKVAEARASDTGRSIVLEGQAGDAWAAGFAAARRSAVSDAPIVLTTGTVLPGPTETYLRGLTGTEGDPDQLTCIADPAACEAAATARGAEINPFTLESILLASDPQGSDYLGTSIDIDGDRMVVGGNRPGNSLGRAVVFERDAQGVWREVAALYGSDDGCTAFGQAVTISGDTIVVGSPRACGGPAEQITVFLRGDDGTWTDVQTIDSPNDDLEGGVRNEGFGATLSLDDGTLFTGTRTFTTPSPNLFRGRGRVDIFLQGADGTFTLNQSILGETEGLGFGAAVEVEGDRAVVGPYLFNDTTGQPNPASVLQRDAAGTWAIDTPLDLQPMGRGFIPTLSLDGDRIAIGSPLGGEPVDGVAMVFRADGDGWDDGVVIDAADGANFGSDVAFLGELLVVGARNSAGENGRVYAFAPDGSDWVQVGARGPDRPKDGSGFGTQWFGSSVATTGDRLLVGASLHTETAGAEGAVFEYTFTP